MLSPPSFIWYNARSQHSIFDEVLEADEHADLDRHDDLAKPKFTFTECAIALVLSLTIVTLLAVFLVERIEDVVESGIPDQFLGLIMLPLVEKAAEHLTAIDEAWDGQIVCLLLRIFVCTILMFCLEFCPIPLRRSFYSDGAFQRPSCRHRRLVHGQRHGPQF
jgi:Ca2+/H+ antiporter